MADLVDGRVERVQVQEEVDALVGEGLHASVVVGLGVHVVDADGVGAQLAHEGRIAFALRDVDEGIFGDELVRDAFQVVLCSVLVEELGPDGGDGLHGVGRQGEAP